MVVNGHGNLASAAMLSEDEQAQSVVISDPHRPDMPIIFVTEEFEAQTGYPPSEVLGRNCRFLQGPDTDPNTIEAIRQAIRDRRPITVDLLNYRKDGSPFWNRLRIRPLLDPRGQLLYFAGAQNPISAEEVRADPIRHPAP